MSNKNYWQKSYLKILLFLVFDEAALTDDLLVQLVEALKKHKESINKQKESETAKEKEKQTSEGRLSQTVLSFKPCRILCIVHKLCLFFGDIMII